MKQLPSPFHHLLFVAALGCAPALAQQPEASPSPKPAAHAHAPAPFLPGGKWHVNDMKRPQPPVVTPGSFSSPEAAAKPPSDAIVLFDGRDVAQWVAVNGDPCPWQIDNGAMVTSNSDIMTKQKFGDLQIHVEYMEPTPPTGSSQGRGNSGVFLMGLFEIQVLDNYNNPTYPDGQAAAVYAQTPPMVNACRPPGEWQVYDIAFTTPRLDAKGNVSTPGYATVFHNGVLVQNHTAIMGPTGPGRLTDYHSVHVSEGPLRLQFHHDPVRFRSVWVRPLVEAQ